MLCLADRQFLGYELWQQARGTGTDLVSPGSRATNRKRLGCIRKRINSVRDLSRSDRESRIFDSHVRRPAYPYFCLRSISCRAVLPGAGCPDRRPYRIKRFLLSELLNLTTLL